MFDTRSKIRKTVVVARPAWSSALLGGCKEKVHESCCRWLAINEAFTTRVAAWPPPRERGDENRKQPVNSKRSIKVGITKLNWTRRHVSQPSIKSAARKPCCKKSILDVFTQFSHIKSSFWWTFSSCSTLRWFHLQMLLVAIFFYKHVNLWISGMKYNIHRLIKINGNVTSIMNIRKVWYIKRMMNW